MRSILIALLLSLRSAAAQEAAVVSEPADTYALEVIREWGERAGMGDLRAKPLDPDDIELRFWSGGGLGTTVAAVLLRTGGVWEGYTVVVNEYTAASPDSLAAAEGLLPSCVVEGMAPRCRISETHVSGSGSRAGQAVGTEYRMQCPHAERLRGGFRQESYARLWDDVVESGVLTLPPEIEREWAMVDGHLYMLEVRVGEEYRASIIEHASPEVAADRQVQAVARRLAGVFGSSLYPYWMEESEGSGE